MRRTPSPNDHARLLPAGRRWGFGAHSVLPYLTLSFQARPHNPALKDEDAIRNPVFPQMENTLGALRHRH